MIYIPLHRRTDNTMTTRKRTNNDIHNTTQKDMRYIDHKKEQTMIYITLHRRTCNTMTTRKRTNNDIHNTTQKDMQYIDHKKENKQ
jgi:hypothetical protein